MLIMTAYFMFTECEVSLLRKGAITRRAGRPDPASKVAESTSPLATAWIMQRKVFYDANYFFVFYYNGADSKFKACSSALGKVWGSPRDVRTIAIMTYLYLGQGIDVHWDESLAKATAVVPYGEWFLWQRLLTTGGVLVVEAESCPVAYINHFIVAPRHGYNNDNILCYHQAVQPPLSIKRGDMIAYNTRNIANGWMTKATDWGIYSNENGGSVTLTREIGNNDQAIYIVKDGDNALYWGYLKTSFVTFPPTSLGIICADGFNTLSGCSETELGLGVGKQHIVYIKSTGELCHMSFNGSWSSEEVLVESGASYPVIACGSDGKLYVFYVKNRKIMLKKYDASAWLAEQQPFLGHDYNNPAYLSSNQNVQNGKICLVWTEGTATPYAVWFCYLED